MVSPYKGNSVKNFNIQKPEVNIEGLFDKYQKDDYSLKYQGTKPLDLNNELDLDEFVNENTLNTTSATSPYYKPSISKVNVKESCCSILNMGVGLLGEGVLELAEGLIDAVASTAAIVGSAGNCVYGMFHDFDYKEENKKLWADIVMPFVGYDMSGKLIDEFYTTNIGAYINEMSAEPFKRKGSVYNIGKSVGTVIAIVMAAYFTGGASCIPITASLASTIIAGMNKMGNAIEKNYNALDDNEKQNMLELGKVNFNGVAQGALESLTWYLTYGNGLGKVGAAMDKSEKLGKVFKNPETKWVSILQSKEKILKIEQKAWIKGGIQMGKSYSSWAIDKFSVGSSKTFGDATYEGIVNAGISMAYDTFAGKKLVDIGKDDIIEAYSPKKLPESEKIANKFIEDLSNSVDEVSPDALDETFRKTLKETGGLPELTHRVSRIVEAYNKTAGTLIKKIETQIVEDIVVLKDELKKLYKIKSGGA